MRTKPLTKTTKRAHLAPIWVVVVALLFASGCPPKPAAEVPPANPLVVPAAFTANDAAPVVNPVVPDAAVVAVDGGPVVADGGAIDGSTGDGGAAVAPTASP